MQRETARNPLEISGRFRGWLGAPGGVWTMPGEGSTPSSSIAILAQPTIYRTLQTQHPYSTLHTMTDGLNISQLAKYFSDEDAARELLEEMRWGKDGAVCPHCGGDQPYKITPKPGSKTRKGLYKCRACRKQFTVTVKTVFEDSHIPISKWLLAIHLLASSKKGISAHQLHRNLGISYKAAWFMMHRLRYAMAEGPYLDLMTGTIEADETYIGGRRKRVRGESKKDAQQHK